MVVVAAAMAFVLIAKPRPAMSAETTAAANPPRPVYTQSPDARQTEAATAAFLTRIREAGSLPVIVGLRMKLKPEDGLSATARRTQGLSLDTMQSRVTARALGRDTASVKRYSFIPYVAMRVNEKQFRTLLADPEVASIEEDGLKTPQLSDSIPLIHADSLRKTFGYAGAGQVIAILDTGVAKTHPMLAGKVVSEACYSTNNATARVSSFCPKGALRSTAKGSGVNCPVKVEGCAHGTHVASIAAGGPIATLRGVASGAGIIAIQVNSKFSKASDCTSAGATPCARAHDSDIISGLNRVYALRGKFKIAAANMSLGGGQFNTVCDGSYPAYVASLAALRLAGIAVIAASGNDGSDTGINSPGCLSDVIAVAASKKGDKSKQIETYYSGSNLNNLVKLAAPGEDILAAVPNGAACARPGSPYCEFSGTSMAAPHVAGAFAVLREAAPRASVDEILSALQCSGKMVELTGVTANPMRLAVPRIDLLGAYNWLKKIPKRSFDFSKTAQAFDWSPLGLDWRIADGKYSAVYSGSPASALALSQIKGCNSNLDVSADLLRKNPPPALNDYWSMGGVVLNMQFDHQTRKFSGYLFRYYMYSSIVTLQTYATAEILKIDDNVSTRLCGVASGAPIRDQAVNKIRAVSDSNTHTFFLNGTRICSAPNNGDYISGAVALFTEFSANRPANGGTFEADNVVIKTLPAVPPSAGAAQKATTSSSVANADTFAPGAAVAPD
jgi:subtilisin family serine protease